MAEKLEEYNQKRQFSKTDEPHGEAPHKASGQLRFVIQHHMASRDHYDFRLEWDGVLKSWAVPKGPSYDSHDKRLAVQVEDHPLEYRNFEGVIPKGQYGGGTVMLWDEGTWQPLEDAGKGFVDGSLKFTLEGSRMLGRWALVRMKPKPGESSHNWLLIKEKDRFENAYDVKQFTTSIRTGRTMAEIEEDTNTPDAPEKQSVQKESIPKVEISHPEKILYEKDGITKGEIAAYYLTVAVRMMPYVANRIISTVRCPGGIDSACFFKRHPSNDKNVLAVPVTASNGETKDYYYVKDISGLLSEVQMNTLEFHTWGSRVETLERPDIMVFDLDPDVGMDLGQIRQGVRDLKSLLDQLSLVSYLKTSGGKGYHIVLPFQPSADWDTFHGFARNIAKTMEATWPDRYTSNVRKQQRKGRIFIDWIRNGRGATSVAPYSVRARDGAPVSMPIAWAELDAVGPQAVTIKDAESRLQQKDPWETFFQNDQQLKG